MVAAAGGDVLAGLARCDRVRSGWERERCYGGAFMENVSGPASAGRRRLSPARPFRLCAEVAPRRRAACFRQQPSYAIYATGGDFAAVFRLCGGVRGRAVRRACHEGLGVDLGGRSIAEHVTPTGAATAAAVRCELGLDRAARQDCAVGAVSSSSTTTATSRRRASCAACSRRPCGAAASARRAPTATGSSRAVTPSAGSAADGTVGAEGTIVIEFRILGPLEVSEHGRRLELGATKQQTLLGVLLLHPGEVVSPARLMHELWGESPPATATKAVQGYISGLRRVLGADRIVTRTRGYALAPAPGELDSAVFERLAADAQARQAGDPAAAAELLREALALWRGEPLQGLDFEGLARNEADRLAEQRLAALERRVEADLALGRHAELVGELQELVAAHPFRERPRAHLMRALYAAGRQADALSLYRETRSLLADELGLEPGEELRRLERLMLAQDPELDAPPAPSVAPARPAPAEAAPPSERRRRLVSVVVAEVTGTAALAERLDPESLHALLDRGFALCAEVMERHGGTVESFSGDSAIGIFGQDQSHEDDALRAVRAAGELRDNAGELGEELERRYGERVAVRHRRRLRRGVRGRRHAATVVRHRRSVPRRHRAQSPRSGGRGPARRARPSPRRAPCPGGGARRRDRRGARRRGARLAPARSRRARAA